MVKPNWFQKKDSAKWLFMAKVHVTKLQYNFLTRKTWSFLKSPNGILKAFNFLKCLNF